MADFTLNVSFTNDDLETLFATGTNVIIAKPAGSEATPNVAWQVFKPLQSNTLTWEEDYGIYASSSEVVNGANLDQLSNVPIPAAMGQIYTLQPSGAISGPDSGGSPNSFTLTNRFADKPYMTVGLYQDAQVNGTAIAGNAISAAPVILNSTARITPFTTVYIWLQSQVKSNSVVTDVYSTMTQLKFGGEVDEISVKYDAAVGTFISANNKLLSAELFKHIEPSL